jgi:hypothetical protein
MNWIPKAVVAFGLYYLTQSFWMSLGIMILLVVMEMLIVDFVERRQQKRKLNP